MAGDGWTRDCARIGILIGKTKTRPNRPIPPPPQFPEFRIQSASDHRFLNRSIALDSINPADYLGLGLRLGGGNALLGCPGSRSSRRIPRPQDVLVTDLFAFSIASCLYRGTRADIIWAIPHIRNNALEVGSHFVVRNQEKRFPWEHFALLISKSDLLMSISLLLVSKSDFLVSNSLLLVSKSDFLVSISLLLVSKSDFLVSNSLLLVSKSDFLASISLLLVSKSDFLASISLLLVSKSDFLVSISLLLVSKSDFLVSISLLLVSKSDFLVSISLLLVSKSDFLVSISLLLVSKSDFLVSVSLLLVSKSDFLVADELASFSDDPAQLYVGSVDGARFRVECFGVSRCRSQMRILAAIEDPVVPRKILDSLG